MEAKELIEATCPECRGPLSEAQYDHQLHEYRCLVGHKYSARSLLQAHSETQERKLWEAVVVLEEAENIVQAVSPELPSELAVHLRQQAEKKRQQAAQIRAILDRLERFAAD